MMVRYLTKCCNAHFTFWDETMVCRKCHCKNPELIEKKMSALDTLVVAVVKASEHCPPDLAREVIEAMDALEAEHDRLKEGILSFAKVTKAVTDERDSLKAELEAVQVSVEHIARCQRGQVEELLSRFKASTVADQIWNWSEANYSNSHEAQAVVEGCYDTEELNEFESLEAFKEHAGIRDDHREDIIAMGGE